MYSLHHRHHMLKTTYYKVLYTKITSSDRAGIAGVAGLQREAATCNLKNPLVCVERSNDNPA